MKLDFVRDNPALAAGIGLPILVAILFGLASEMPRWFVAPPRYDALFAVEVPPRHHVTGEVTYEIRGARLKALRRFDTRDEVDSGQYKNMCLYFFYARTLSVREIAVSPDATPEEKLWHEISLPGVQTLVLDPRDRSPDGYELHLRKGEARGFWPFFDRVSSHDALTLEKDGRQIRLQLPDPAASRMNTDKVQFLGWVIGRNS